MHLLTAELYLLENEPGASRQQLLRTHRPPFGWPSELLGRVGLPEAGPAMQGPCQDSVQQANRTPVATRLHGKCARAREVPAGGHVRLTWPRSPGLGWQIWPVDCARRDHEP